METEEVRTVWSWDDASVEKASKRIEAHFAKVDAATKKSTQTAQQENAKRTAPGHGGKGGHGSDSNLTAGIRDFAEGRVQNSLTRFTQVAKLAGPAVTAVFAAFKVGKWAVENVREQIEATDKAGLRLTDSLQKASKAATFSGLGDSTQKLSANKEALEDQIAGERDQQGDLRELKNKGILTSGWDFLRSHGAGINPLFNGSLTTDGKMAESEMRQRVAGQQWAKQRRLFSGVLEHETGAEREKIKGDPFEAQKMESEKREALAVQEARATGQGSEKNLALIHERFALEREGIAKAQAAADRQVATENELLNIKRRGGAVEVLSAKERLAAAEKAVAAEYVGTRAYYTAVNAHEKARQDVVLAERAQKLDVSAFNVDLPTAKFRGNTDERAARLAQDEVTKARERLQILQQTKGVTADDKEIREAALAVATAETNQEYLRRQQVAARRQLESGLRLAPVSIRAAGALLGGASPEAAQRQGLVAQAEAAREAFELARKRAIEEKGSLESLEGQRAAAEALARAQIAVATHDREIRRERSRELRGSQGQTAALRLSAEGRDDLAEVVGQRAQSRLAIEQANYEKKPAMARELAEQQRLRERRTVQDLYLNADGSRRNPGDVNKEMFERRLKQTRTQQFNRSLDRNGGLLDVRRDLNGRITGGRDPLTGDILNARQIAERNSAAMAKDNNPKEDKSDSETFGKILTCLEQRLPKEAL